MPRLKQIGIDVEINGVIEKYRRALSETENDILRRLLLADVAREEERGDPSNGAGARSGPPRRRGLWTVELNGERLPARSLKDAYRTLLLELDRLDSAFLQRFSLEQSRARRFVARHPKQLYLASPALAKDFAERLTDDWYFDTNLSADQVARRIRVAARLCGLNYGRDLRILNNLLEI